MIKEQTIKEHLGDYLKTREVPFFKEFRLPTGQRIDFASFQWLDEYEIEICGYECKGSVSAKTADRLLSGQIADYQIIFPKTYLVTNLKEKEKVLNLCEVRGVGLIHFDENGSMDILEAPDKRQLILDDNHFLRLRAIAAMFLAFEPCFNDILGNDPPNRGVHWCSTSEPMDQVQYTCGYNQVLGAVYCAANLENSENVLKRVDLSQLGEDISSLPEDYWFKAGITRYVAPQKPVYTTLIQVEASSFGFDGLAYLKERTSRDKVWLQVGKDIWTHNEILPRTLHTDRITSARKDLAGVHRILSESSR